MTRVFGIVEICVYGISIFWGGLLAAAVLFTKLKGQSSITLSFNNYGEHLIESIIFPLVVLLAFIFLSIRAYRFGNQKKKI